MKTILVALLAIFVVQSFAFGAVSHSPVFFVEAGAAFVLIAIIVTSGRGDGETGRDKHERETITPEYVVEHIRICEQCARKLGAAIKKYEGGE